MKPLVRFAPWLAPLLSLVLVSAGFAEGGAPQPISKTEAQTKVRSFNAFFKTKGRTLPAIEQHEKIQELRRLAMWDHELIVKRIADLLRKSKNEAYRLEAATHLGRLKSSPKIATRALAPYVSLTEKNGPLLARVIHALGVHKHEPSLDKITKCLDHENDQVFMETVWAMGEIGHYKSIKVLAPVFDVNFTAPNKGVNVRVDTGAAGNADRLAAQAKGKSRQKKKRPNREKVLAEIRGALEKITGKKFEKPEHLREWMKENKTELKLRSKR